MSTIPYNYGKYIDDKVSMSNSGTVDAGRQVQSPASAGSRGLAKTTQFTKDPTQMKMGNSPIAESMVEIRNILNRIDGVNVPVKEDADDDWSKVTNALIKKYGEDKAKAITDYAQIGTDSAEELMKSHGLTHKGDGKDEERWFQKYPWLKQLANKSWMGRLKDIAGEGPDYGTPVKMESAVNELADDDKIEFTKVMLDISQIKDRVEALSVDEEAKKSAIQSLTNAEEALVALDESAVREDDGLTQAYKQIAQLASDVDENPEDAEDQWELSSEVARPITKILKQIMDYDKGEQMPDGSDMSYADMFKKVSVLANKGAQTNDPKMAAEIFKTMSSVYDMKQVAEESVSEDSDELARLKELSGIEEDTNDDIIQWAKKYSQYKNLEDDNLIEALYEYAFELGIAQLTFEVGELQAAERKIGKKQEDWEDAEINAAMEMSPISNGLLDDLHRILPGDAELEQKLDSIRGMLQKAGLKEDKYQPFPEEDEMTFEDDDEFYEAFGELGFPEDENELFDAEYRGRKVPLNKPMRGDVKKFKVYVKDPKSGNVKKVNFGHGGSSARKAGQKTMKIRKSNPKARKSFRARHNCANPGPKTKARYWSCRKW